MKLTWILVAAGAQVLALAWMAGEREYVARCGQTVWLRTVPVDPRDFMRGDYVRLQYDFSFVPRSSMRGALTNNAPSDRRRLAEDARVYAQLKVGEDGLAQLVSLSDSRPADGLCLRGRVESESPAGVSVRYGVEAYFMEQGRAVELERRPAASTEVPLEMEAALGASGIAVLKGYRWGPLGIALELDIKEAVTNAPATPGAPRGRQVVGARVRLVNATTNRPVAVVTAPEAFSLIPDTRWPEGNWVWVGRGATASSLRASDIVVLQPGQSQTVALRLTEPQWFILPAKSSERRGGEALKPDGPVALNEATPAWTVRFRLEYAPPNAAACAGLPGAEQVWHGRVVTRAFGPDG